jgi:SAM-dependent methyltransferase
MTNSIERFTSRVNDYAKYRPRYPREVVGYLQNEWGLTPDWTIADVGSGTGISSKLFLKNGNHVVGVEPNDAMRATAEEYLDDFQAFTSAKGTAEATTLADEAVEMVLAGQAFHWFDQNKCRQEFRRILKQNGIVVLMWNERQLDTTPYLREYEQLLIKYSTDYAVVRHDNFGEDVLTAFFGHAPAMAVFPNVQNFDLDGVKGRMMSSSYVPAEGEPRFDDMIRELAELFAKHSQNDRIDVLYDTKVYVGRL